MTLFVLHNWALVGSMDEDASPTRVYSYRKKLNLFLQDLALILKGGKNENFRVVSLQILRYMGTPSCFLLFSQREILIVTSYLLTFLGNDILHKTDES